MVGEEAAEEGSGDACEHEDHLDVALVTAALARRDDVRDDRHRERHQAAGAQPLKRAEGDQLAERLRGARERRTGEEYSDRAEEEGLTAVEVADPAPERGRDGRGQEIGGDDPRELVEAS